MERRDLLKAAAGIGIVLGGRGPGIEREAAAREAAARAAAAQASGDAAARPRAGDRFVFALGARRGETIAPGDVAPGGPLLLAWPADPATGTVRDGSRLNQVVLVRLDPATLDAATAARAADGIVAYSGVCSHTGCDVSEWIDSTRTLLCPCHDSEFDPARGAEVVLGPAPRRLAALPLAIVGGGLVASDGFVGRLGADPP